MMKRNKFIYLLKNSAMLWGAFLALVLLSSVIIWKKETPLHGDLRRSWIIVPQVLTMERDWTCQTLNPRISFHGKYVDLPVVVNRHWYVDDEGEVVYTQKFDEKGNLVYTDPIERSFHFVKNYTLQDAEDDARGVWKLIGSNQDSIEILSKGKKKKSPYVGRYSVEIIKENRNGCDYRFLILKNDSTFIYGVEECHAKELLMQK